MNDHLKSGRGVYCNRTLNLRQIKAVGYDMDYTLVHYRVEEWERRAYEYARSKLAAEGWPVDALEFDPTRVIRGLILDLDLGNVVKANRFGFVKKALHGTKPLEFAAQREAYARTQVDLSDNRWVFLNTLFSLSEGCLYMQLVDLLDAGLIPGPMGYWELYECVRQAMDKTHMQGALKAEIMAAPERFVVPEPETALALLDQKHSGKKVVLITNSEWEYTRSMMHFAFDPYLPAGLTWRDMFDVVVVSARKPDFFTARAPFFEVVTEEGLLKPHSGPLQAGKAYLGGSASELERAIGVSGDEILYVGDHMFGDVHVSKSALRWRTALILRELEEEVIAIEHFRESEKTIMHRMHEKEEIEAELALFRIAQQRKKLGYGPTDVPHASDAEITAYRERVQVLDAELAPLAEMASTLHNPVWGLLTRAGNDKSHLARQIERYADIYTSRVSNFVHITPFAYLRSPRGSLPHDPGTQYEE